MYLRVASYDRHCCTVGRSGPDHVVVQWMYARDDLRWWRMTAYPSWLFSAFCERESAKRNRNSDYVLLVLVDAVSDGFQRPRRRTVRGGGGGDRFEKDKTNGRGVVGRRQSVGGAARVDKASAMIDQATTMDDGRDSSTDWPSAARALKRFNSVPVNLHLASTRPLYPSDSANGSGDTTALQSEADVESESESPLSTASASASGSGSGSGSGFGSGSGSGCCSTCCSETGVPSASFVFSSLSGPGSGPGSGSRSSCGFRPCEKSRLRWRSSSVVLSLCSELPFVPVSASPRLKELRREASVRSYIEEDYANEKFVRNSLQLSDSWAAFMLKDDGDAPEPLPSSSTASCRSKSVSEPVHIFTNLHPSSCSPSPTRIEKQCFSPSMQQVVKSIALSPNPTNSPPKRPCFRSLSPIAVRHGLKRKYDSDSACSFSAAKRPSWNGPVSFSEDVVWEPFFGYGRFRHRRSTNGSMASVVGPLLDDSRQVFEDKKTSVSTSDDSCLEMSDDAVDNKCLSESDNSDFAVLDPLMDSN